jgi:hypothetical protein
MTPITERALIKRINRALAKKNQVLHKSRTRGQLSNLGQFYVLERGYTNGLIDFHVNIETLDRPRSDSTP